MSVNLSLGKDQVFIKVLLLDSVLFSDHFDSAELKAFDHFIYRGTVADFVDTILLSVSDAKLITHDITGLL